LIFSLQRRRSGSLGPLSPSHLNELAEPLKLSRRLSNAKVLKFSQNIKEFMALGQRDFSLVIEAKL